MLLEECLDPLDIQDARFFYRSALAVRPLVLPVPHFPILALVHIFCPAYCSAIFATPFIVLG